MVGGTAAGMVDATNGEGIFEAAMSGRFAAESVAREQGTDPHRAASRYARTGGRALSPPLGSSRAPDALPRTAADALCDSFSPLAGAPRLAEVLLKESHERSIGDRLYLSREAFRFGLRTAG